MDRKSETRFETHKVDRRQVLKNLRRRIRVCERRYEIASSEMLKGLSAGNVRETAEILKWMQAYHALRMIERRTPTTGTHTMITA